MPTANPVYMPFLRCPFNHGVEKNRNEEDVYRIAAGTPAENCRDVPFSAVCRVANQQVYVLLGSGISADHPVQSLLWHGGDLVARLRRRHPGMRERARHFGGDVRIESSHNGPKISFLFPTSRNRPPIRERRLRPKSNNPALSIPFRPPGW